MIEIRWFREHMTMEKMLEHNIPGVPYNYGNRFPARLQYRLGDGDWLDVPSVDEPITAE